MFTRARRHATASAPRPRSDTGQAALVLVIAFSLVLTIFGGVMVTTIVNNAPIVAQTTIQRYAYRAMLSGLNSYTSAINANPYLAACNTTNAGSSICAGITYQSWSQVGGTDTGNGVIPELYKFDNPQSVTASPDCHSTPVHGLEATCPARTAQKYLQLLAVSWAPESWKGSDSKFDHHTLLRNPFFGT